MNIRTIFSFIMIVTTTIFWTGCGKEGPQGPAGLNGLDGNANVTASSWITPLDWAGSSGDWYFDVSSTIINQDVVEAGAVLAYISLPGDLYNDYTVRPLPAYAIKANWDFLLPNDGTNYGKIEFTSDMVNKPGTSGYNFRFIVIPASYILKSARLKSKSTTDLKNMSYHDVCMELGIKE
jgi:hypothetical protein